MKRSLQGFVYNHIAFIDGDFRRPNERLRDVVGFAWSFVPAFEGKLVEVLEWGCLITSGDISPNHGLYQGASKEIIVSDGLLDTVWRQGPANSGPLEAQMAMQTEGRRREMSGPPESEGYATAAATFVHETEHARQHMENGNRERTPAQHIQDEVDAQRAGIHAWSVLRPRVRSEGSEYARHLDHMLTLWRENRVHEYVMSHSGYQESHLGTKIVG